MYLKIQTINDQIFFKAQNYFSKDYISKLKLKSTYKESLVARYLIDQNIIPQNKNIYSCISHKDNLVFIWVSDYKLWVDIEIYKKRDISLLNTFLEKEYNLFWEQNWNNFYIIWTAKESIVKLLNQKLDDINNYTIINIKNINKTISWIKFNYSLFIQTNIWIIQVLSWKKNNYFYSICFKKTNMIL